MSTRSSTSSFSGRAANTSVFLSGLVVVHVLLGALHTVIPLRDSRVFQTAAQFRAYTGPLQTLVLGDSHAKCAIDARELPGGFNNAVLGGIALTSELVLREALEERGAAPDRVVLSLDTHALAWQRNRLWEPAYWSGRMPFPLLAEQSGGTWKAVSNWIRYVVFPYAGRGDEITGRILGLDTGRTEVPLERGWLALDSRWSEVAPEKAQNEATARAAFLHDDYTLYDPEMVASYERIFALCTRHGIDVVLVRFPLPAETTAAIGEHVDIPSFDARMHAMAPEGTVFLDYLHAFTGHPEYFADADHMNAAGATALTAMLKRDLE